MSDASQETAIRSVLARLDAAWRRKRFAGFEDCFDENAVITGPDYAQFAMGRADCAQSYREFATNAAVLSYSESNHQLRIWAHTAVYTFSWQMTYERDRGPKRESGTDQFVLGLEQGQWRILFRQILFTSS